MIPINPLVTDRAKPILDALPLSTADKSALWDCFYDAPDAETLARTLSRLPAQIVEPLVNAKRLATQTTAAVPAEHTKAIAPVLKAAEHLSKIAPDTLDLAENHPHVLRHLTQTVLDSRAPEETK